MEKRVFEYIEKENMLSGVNTVVAGISGGADSVCLLLLLHKYAKMHPFRLIAAHVHHGLRENADGDETYVKALCEELDIPLRIRHIDAAKIAEEKNVSVEEAGRMERYAFFREILSGETAGRIAVAHHLNDQAETVLFQMIRGSGISGMRGMLPVSDDIIRPLLCVKKEEIEAYLQSEGRTWRTDESNLDASVSRNKIRLEILPKAEEICEGASEHIANAAERLREVEEYLCIQAKAEEGRVLSERKMPDGGTKIRLKNELLSLPKALQGEIVKNALVRIAGKKRDIGHVQVAAVLDLFASQVGRKRAFIYGLSASREYDGVLIGIEGCSATGTGPSEPDEEISLKELLPDGSEHVGKTASFRLGNAFEGNVELIETEGTGDVPKDVYKKWLSIAVWEADSVFRHPMEDDYIVIHKDGSRKKLKDYLADEKVPFEERDRVWVLASGNRIYWVIGKRISEDAKVMPEDRQVLCLDLKSLNCGE